jgi:hypothetical protein
MAGSIKFQVKLYSQRMMQCKTVFSEPALGAYRNEYLPSCQPDELKVYLDKLGIDSLIDGIACGTDVKHGKPHPDLFEFGLRRLCCDAPSSLTLGSPYDANAACLAHLNPFKE